MNGRTGQGSKERIPPMNNVTKFRIAKPARDVFEAFADPAKIGNFWFSSSSARWETGKTVALEYDLYGAVLDIRLAEVEPNERIVFLWGEGEDEHTVSIVFRETADRSATIVEVTEEGFREDDPDLIAKLIDNKEGWVFMLTCLKAYLEFGVKDLRGALER